MKDPTTNSTLYVWDSLDHGVCRGFIYTSELVHINILQLESNIFTSLHLLEPLVQVGY
jgi:hypothetical protein